MTVRGETSAESAARFSKAYEARLKYESRRDASAESQAALLIQLADRLDLTPRRTRDLAAAVLLVRSAEGWRRVDKALERLCDYGIARWTRHGYVRGPQRDVRRVTEGK